MFGMAIPAISGLSLKGAALPLLGAGLIALSAYLAWRDHGIAEGSAARAELNRLEDVARDNEEAKARLKASWAALRRAEKKAQLSAAKAERDARPLAPREEIPLCPADCILQ